MAGAPGKVPKMRGTNAAHRVLPLILLAALTTGCYINLTDLTPKEFVWLDSRDDPAGLSAEALAIVSERKELHAFRLQVATGSFVNNVRAYVTVNGTEYAMTSNGRIYISAPTDMCHSEYRYRFRATGDWASATSLPPGGAELVVPVTGWGNPIFFVPGQPVYTMPNVPDESAVVLRVDPTPDVRFIIQNLTGDLFTISSMMLDTGFPDTRYFGFDAGTLPRTLKCGEQLPVIVKLHPLLPGQQYPKGMRTQIIVDGYTQGQAPTTWGKIRIDAQ